MTANSNNSVTPNAQRSVVTPAPDLLAAQRFLSRFKGQQTFQAFDDTNQGRGDLAGIFHGGVEQLERLTQLNQRGAGVFFTVNQTDQKGRRAENIEAIRAVFLDLDGAPLQPVLDAGEKSGIEPHLIVETSPDRFHVYWLVEGATLENFSTIQKALAAKFDGDPKVCDLPRVMRIPGFFHQKEQPFLSHIQSEGTGSAYKAHDLMKGLDLDMVLAFPDRSKRPDREAKDGADDDDDVVTEGGRNDTLASRAGHMRRVGMSQEAITEALLAENKARCWPPLDEREVRTIARSVGKYRPDDRASVPVLGYAEIEQKISDNEEPSVLTGKIADLVTASQLRNAEKDTLRRLIAKKANTSVAALIKDARQMENTEESHYATATAAIAKLGADNLIYAQGSFWHWKGRVWARIDDREIKRAIHAVIGSSDLTGNTVNSVLDLVKTERYQPELVFDQASGVINCRNGELSYLDGEWQLGPHRRDRYLTTMIPVEYDPAAKAPRFNQFLFEVFKGDVDELEKIILVGEALGYSLIPSCHLEKFFLLIGSGANGKSVLLGVLKDLLGAENVAAVKPSQFNSNFQRAYLRGMLANIVTEIEVGSQLADGLKALTSGEPITAEQKHRDPFTFTPFATQWLGTNHFPHVGDVSGGFTRRAIVLTFNQHFAEGCRDVHLAGKLRAELPGILNIALDGLARLYRNNRFTGPESCARAMRRWLSEVDQVSEFVEEECEEGPALEVESGALYAAFQSWAATAGIQRRVTHKTFSSRLESRGFGRVRGGGGVRMITGLTVKGAPADFYQHREG